MREAFFYCKPQWFCHAANILNFGLYYISKWYYCVIGTDAATGCSGNDCITIIVDVVNIPCGALFIPNAFSPNNDGDNDVLKVYMENLNCFKEFYFVIFNRWGEKVFESYDQKKGWDGMFQDKWLDSAVFNYYLEATLTSEEKIKKKGNISLLR
ncbi:MAG: gliding motility-associated C-terminal domain-containing protein [Bacteroidetes bacterium]|nr:gliding motility-associated C-terminal domain-containing protein [Bacteroidota bacterium]